MSPTPSMPVSRAPTIGLALSDRAKTAATMLTFVATVALRGAMVRHVPGVPARPTASPVFRLFEQGKRRHTAPEPLTRLGHDTMLPNQMSCNSINRPQVHAKRRVSSKEPRMMLVNRHSLQGQQVHDIAMLRQVIIRQSATIQRRRHCGIPACVQPGRAQIVPVNRR